MILSVSFSGGVDSYEVKLPVGGRLVAFSVSGELDADISSGGLGSISIARKALLSFDKNINSSWFDSSSDAVIAVRSGILAFPIQVEKGQSVFVTVLNQCIVQLWIEENPS